MKFLPRIIPGILLLISIYPVFSQQVESLHSANVGYPGISYSYEYALGKQFSINLEAGTNLSWQTDNYNKSTTINFYPAIQLEPRIYYSVKTRYKYDSFFNNSASFFCISSGIRMDSFSFRNNTPNLFVVPKWGFRRAMGKHFIFETKIGGGIKFRNGSSQFEPGLDVKFGYVF